MDRDRRRRSRRAHFRGRLPSASYFVPSAQAAVKDAARRFAVPFLASLTAASLRAAGFYGRRHEPSPTVLC